MRGRWRQGRPAAPGGPVLVPHRGVAPGMRRGGARGPLCGGAPGEGVARGGGARESEQEDRTARGRLGQAQAGIGHCGKSSRALGDACRGRGQRAQAEAVIDACVAALAPLIGTGPACRAAGKSKATHYRALAPPVQGPPRPRGTPPNALSEAETDALLDVLRSDRFRDLAPAQVWAMLLDDNRYLASISTMYRVLRAAGELHERRA